MLVTSSVLQLSAPQCDGDDTTTTAETNWTTTTATTETLTEATESLTGHRNGIMEEGEAVASCAASPPPLATSRRSRGSLHRLRPNNGVISGPGGRPVLVRYNSTVKRKASLTPSMRQLQTYLTREVSRTPCCEADTASTFSVTSIEVFGQLSQVPATSQCRAFPVTVFFS